MTQPLVRVLMVSMARLFCCAGIYVYVVFGFSIVWYLLFFNRAGRGVEMYYVVRNRSSVIGWQILKLT
jgi:hypothetical protein